MVDDNTRGCTLKNGAELCQDQAHDVDVRGGEFLGITDTRSADRSAPVIQHRTKEMDRTVILVRGQMSNDSCSIYEPAERLPNKFWSMSKGDGHSTGIIKAFQK